MGRWKDSVLRVTRTRKKRYWRRRGWVWSSVAFVRGGWGDRLVVVVVLVVGSAVGEAEDGRGIFSMRDHVR